MSVHLSRNLVRLSNLPQLQSFFHRTFSTPKSSEVKLPEYHEGRLEGTVGEHQCYVLLHSPYSPEAFPSVYKTPLQLELQGRATKWGGLVNFSWFEGAAPAPNTQPATVFSHLGGKLEIPDVTMENIDKIEGLIRQHLEGPVTKSTSEDMHIYVCTHGARDCRCGDRGVQVYKALLEATKAEQMANPTGPANRIKIGEVGHVGGHKLSYSFRLLCPLSLTFLHQVCSKCFVVSTRRMVRTPSSYQSA